MNYSNYSKDSLEHSNTSSYKQFGLRVLQIMPLIWAFCIPLSRKISPIPLTIWLILNIIFFDKKVIKFFWGGAALCLAFYLVLFYSQLLSFPVRPISKSSTLLTLLILPLCLFLGGYARSNILLIKRFFIYGNLFALAILILKATFLFFIEGTTKYFFGSPFCYFHQTVYTSFNFILCLLFFVEGKVFISRKIKIVSILVFITGIFLVANRAGIVTLVAISLIYSFKNGFNLLGIKRFFITLVFASIYIYCSPRFETEQANAILHEAKYADPRITIWKAGLTVLDESFSWFGLGKLETKNHLIAVYNRYNFTIGVNSCWNTHNQYLYFLLSSGIIGLSVVIVFLVFIFRYALLSDNRTYYLMLCIAFCIELFFEKMSGKYSGVMIMSFIMSILFYKPGEEIKKLKL